MAIEGEDKDHWLDFSLGIGGFAEVGVVTTPVADKRKIHVHVPPGKLIPIVFLPGIMGSNLRLSKARQQQLKRSDNIAWRPDDAGDGWSRRNDEPADRQMRLDSDEVEVDRYEVTDNGPAGYDATGDQTVSSDKRHGNVPDNLGNISKLLINDPKADPNHPLAANRQSFTAAQKARARGWSEVMFSAYGDIIQRMETQLNDMLRGQGAEVRLSPIWAAPGNRFGTMRRDRAAVRDIGAAAPAMRDPSTFGATGAPPLTAADIKKIGNCWYPVHAFGYNWLKSNGEEAKALAPKIDKLIKTYNDNGFDCPGVILVTHSMGGILARALIHPDYGNIKDKVLGIVHGVMPTTGAAAAYKRMRAGFEGGGIKADIIQGVLGDDGAKVTAVLANAQGGLELLPAAAYGTQWLRVQDQGGKFLAQWPQGNAVDEIYTAGPHQWWRLINPAWIDPAGQIDKPPNKGGKTEEQIGPKATMERVKEAMKFANTIQNTFHERTYAHYGHDPEHLAWNEVSWRVVDGDAAKAGDPANWTPVPGEKGDNKTGLLKVRGNHGVELILKLQPPVAAADGTVPVERSASKVKAKVKFIQRGYDHQDSYKSPDSGASTLYGIVRIANEFDPPWWDRKD